MEDTRTDKILQVYEYLTFLSSSAQGLFVEPREYGPLRCIDAMRRFIDIVIRLKIIEDESLIKELEDLRKELDRGVVLLMYSTEGFKKFVTELNVKLAEKVSKLLNI